MSTVDFSRGRRRRGSWQRARYRVSQFTRGLRPDLAPREIAAVRAMLSPAELDLFLAAEPRDRRHSFDLYRLLQQGAAGGAPSHDVLRAALLHDVGKGPLLVWDRVAFVLLCAASPSLTERLALRLNAPREASSGLRRRRDALWRLRHHAALGADLVEAAGALPRVVELVRRHTEASPPDDEELASFIAADDRV